MSLFVRKTVQFIGKIVKLSRPVVYSKSNNKQLLTSDVLGRSAHTNSNTEEDLVNRLLEQWCCGVQHFGKLKLNVPFETRVSSLNPQLYPDMNKVIIRLLYIAPEMPATDDVHEFLSGLTKLYEVKFDTHDDMCPEEITVDGRFKAAKLPISCHCEIPIKFDLDVNSSESIVIQGMESDTINVKAKSCTFISTKSGSISATCSEGDLVCQNLLQGNLNLQVKGNSNILTDRLQGTEITCSTDNGNITCSSVYSSKAGFTSQNGNIKLTNCHADTHVTVPEGNLTIDSFEGNLNADVQKGSTDIFITRPEQVKVKSETGDISLRVDKTINSEFELHGKTVTVDDTLEFREESSTACDNKNSVKGCMNGSQAMISVETSEGCVNVKQHDWFQSLNLKFQSG
ncbi:protein FAM185A-like [Ylistrum balloti]|uniref:protein FAM185A-like n=1 Tax=Ylistrum balloti TaxID=509963 RepID=UPI002905ADB6|nr:protein FAM185A-like [Ylistrum balloti]